MRRHVFLFRDGEEARELVLERLDGSIEVGLGGRKEKLDSVLLPDGRRSVLLEDGRQLCGRALPDLAGFVDVRVPGKRRRIQLADPLRDRIAHSPRARASADAGQEIRASMPGRVVSVAVRSGDRVDPGALLLVLEAMKMQNEIRAESAGVVERVGVCDGQAVEGGSVMLTLRPAD